METPVKIDFQGMDAHSDVRSAIVKHLTQLEGRFSRITAGRVVLKALGDHHHKGGLYEVSIRLALQEGREVNIGHTAQTDERHSDPTFAINDAFKRARRSCKTRSANCRDRLSTTMERRSGTDRLDRCPFSGVKRT